MDVFSNGVALQLICETRECELRRFKSGGGEDAPGTSPSSSRSSALTAAKIARITCPAGRVAHSRGVSLD
jgi:hypothetical protein